MKLQIALFATARQLMGKPILEVDIEEGAGITVRELRAAIADQFPQLQPLLTSSAFAIDHEYATDNDRITVKSEIALIPPVSGG